MKRRNRRESRIFSSGKRAIKNNHSRKNITLKSETHRRKITRKKQLQ